jgi:glycosyltransferase involved in cell wall biosynthesis
MSEILVSVIIVFRNEAGYLTDCLESVLSQFGQDDRWELILVDGQSTDQSVQVANYFLKSNGVAYTLLENSRLTLASGWNIGIRAAKGKYIIRPDAHAVLQPGYINTGIETLKSIPDAAVAGGVLETRGKTLMGKVICEALSMKTGVGNSSFRTGAPSGFYDTAVYGIYRKEVFDKVGLFNEELERHQDTELHWRMHQKGMNFYMNNEMVAVYFCRDSLPALGKQMYRIGFCFSDLIKAGARGALGLRHRIPMMFYLYLVAILILSLMIPRMMELFWLTIIVYLSVIMLESMLKCMKNRNLIALGAIFVIPWMHINYALGTFWGLMNLSGK